MNRLSLITSFGNRLRLLLNCGLTPHKLAMTVCFGIAIGLLPLPCRATLLCLVCGQLFGLNQVALQAVNYLIYPLQLALLIPFCLLGARIITWGPALPAELIETVLHGRLSANITLLAWISLKAVTIWLITAVPLTALLYLPLLRIFERRIAGRPAAGNISVRPGGSITEQDA